MDKLEAGPERSSVLGGLVTNHQCFDRGGAKGLAGVEENLLAWFQTAQRGGLPDGVKVGFRQTDGREFFRRRTVVRKDSELVAPLAQDGDELFQMRARAELLVDDLHLQGHICPVKPLPASFRPFFGSPAHKGEKRVIVVRCFVKMSVTQPFPAFSLRSEHSDVQRIRKNQPQREMTGLVKSPIQIKNNCF